MTRNILGGALVVVFATTGLTAACSSNSSGSSTDGTGGAGTSTGGSSSGGAVGAGGSSSGGSTSTGGAGTGGTTSTGGATNTGGTTSTGGASNTGGVSNTGGTTSTGGTGDAGTDAGAGTGNCGAAPLDPITINFESTKSFRGTGRITSSGCAGPVLSWEAGDGPLPTQFADGVTVWVRNDPSAGYLPTYFPEIKPVTGFDKYLGALQWDDDAIAKYQLLVPSYDPTTMSLIAVQTVSDKYGTSPCDVDSGITYSVAGHPEAIITYGNLKNGTLALGTATDASGEAYITLTPTSSLEYVSLTGTKSGCTIKNSGLIYTGRIPVAPGTTSNGLAY